MIGFTKLMGSFGAALTGQKNPLETPASPTPESPISMNIWKPRRAGAGLPLINTNAPIPPKGF